MKRLALALTLLSACGAPQAEIVPIDGSPPPLRTDCYNSTVPPELAPEEIRNLPPC